jgi:hypothetical protein
MHMTNIMEFYFILVDLNQYHGMSHGILFKTILHEKYYGILFQSSRKI